MKDDAYEGILKPGDFGLYVITTEGLVETMTLPLPNDGSDASPREYALPVFYNEANAEKAMTTFLEDSDNWMVFGSRHPVGALRLLAHYREAISLVLLDPIGGSEEYVRCVHIDDLIEELVNMETEH